ADTTYSYIAAARSGRFSTSSARWALSFLRCMSGASRSSAISAPYTNEPLGRRIRHTPMRCPALLLLAALPLAAQPLTTEQWRADLAVLATELPARHTRPFTHIASHGWRHFHRRGSLLKEISSLTSRS